MKNKLKDFSVLLSGGFLSQLINLIATIFISRIYSPYDFGLNSLFISFASVFALYSSFGLEFLIINDNNKKSTSIFYNSLLIIFFNSIFCTLIYSLFFFLNAFSVGKLGLLSIPLIFFMVIFSSINIVLKSWNIQSGRIKYISLSQITRNSTRAFFQFSLSIFGADYFFLSLSEVLGFIGSNYIQSKQKVKFIYSRIIKYSRINFYKFLREYKSRIFYLCSSNILNKIGLVLPVIMILNFYGEENSGYFALVMTVLSVPSVILVNVFGDLFQKELVSNKAKIKTTFKRNFKILLIISLSVFLLIFFLSESLFELVYGDKWAVSGTMSKYLSIIFFGQILVVPLSRLIYIINKEKLKLIYDSLMLISSLFPFIISNYFTFSIYNCLLLYSVLRATSYLIYLIIINEYVKKHTSITYM
jgi:O-antigen/teichoic acid export membrane protein